MNSRTHISDELRELNSSLPATAIEPVFTVPEGYFEHFAASVLAKLKAQEPVAVSDELSALSPLLAAIPKKMPYSTPDNYFSELTGGLQSLTNEEVLPTVLRDHSRQMPYEVPAAYFESLPEVILAAHRDRLLLVPGDRHGLRRAVSNRADSIYVGCIVF